MAQLPSMMFTRTQVPHKIALASLQCEQKAWRSEFLPLMGDAATATRGDLESVAAGFRLGGYNRYLQRGPKMETPVPRGENFRVQNRYNLTVPRVFLNDLGLPTVPQSQRDTLIHVAS